MDLRALSITTIALSTSIPIAMINPASDVRFIPSPIKYIMSIVPPMVNISDAPISTPLRKPIASIIIRITIATEINTLSINEILASRAISSSGYNGTSSIPTGICPCKRSITPRTSAPSLTTSALSSDDTPTPTARRPSTFRIIVVGSAYACSMRATSPRRNCWPLEAISS